MIKKIFTQSHLNSGPFSRRQFSSFWIEQKLKALQSSDKTIGIVVHQDEVKSGELDGVVLPTGLSKSKQFRQDLNMSNAYWFYHSFNNAQMKRVLLIQKNKDKKGAT